LRVNYGRRIGARRAKRRVYNENRRNVLTTSAIGALSLALLSDNALAQKAADMDGVKAASKAFYETLAVLDNGEAMEKVWAHRPLKPVYIEMFSAS
jgi:hypothetical protein